MMCRFSESLSVERKVHPECNQSVTVQNILTKFTEGHQYQRTDGLVGTGLMPYKAHSPKYQHFMLLSVPVYLKYEI